LRMKQKESSPERRSMKAYLTKSASGMPRTASINLDERERKHVKTPSKSALRGNDSPRRKGSLKVSFNLGRNQKLILSSSESELENELEI